MRTGLRCRIEFTTIDELFQAFYIGCITSFQENFRLIIKTVKCIWRTASKPLLLTSACLREAKIAGTWQPRK